MALFITRILNTEADTTFKGRIYTSFEGNVKPFDWSISTACFVEAITSLLSSDSTKDRYKIHEAASRSDYLDHELQIMKPRRFGLNLPGRDFRFELEDLVPALAGTIGIMDEVSISEIHF